MLSFSRKSRLLLSLFISFVSAPILASPEFAKAKNCLACHTQSQKLLGPAFDDIAKKYSGQEGADIRLAANIRNGVVGVWTPFGMPPQPQVSQDDALQLARWILNGKTITASAAPPPSPQTRGAESETSNVLSLLSEALAIRNEQRTQGVQQRAQVVQQSNSQPSAQVRSGQSNPTGSSTVHVLSGGPLGNSDKRRQTGTVTELCVKFRNLHVNESGMQWYEFTNGCTETIQIWHTFTSDKFGNLAVLKAGQSDKSWYSVTGQYARTGIRYFACRETERGQRVYYSEKDGFCYYMEP